MSSSVRYRAGRSGPPAARTRTLAPGWRDVPRAARLGAALLGLGVIAVYLGIAVSRLSYPFPLEYLESNSLVEVQRILAGHALYASPDVGYVPDGYPPLYFATSAAAASVLGLSYLPLRLVSLVSSLACFAVLARLVQRETASAAAGIAAAGLLAATYAVTHTWFDVARVDSLFIALSAAALYAARWMRRKRGAVATGLLLAAVFLTKQNGLAEGVAVLTAAAFGPRRRLAWTASLTYGTVIGISTLALGLASHGWYVFYVFVLMGEHTLNHAAFGQFWTVHLLPVLGIAGAALVLGVRRTPLVLVAGCAAFVVESYATLVHSGGEANDLLPAYLAVALLAGLALGSQSGGLVSYLADQLASGRLPNWRAGAASRWVAAVAAALVIAQLAVLVDGFRPARAIPTDADRAAGLRLAAGLRALGGSVAVPSDPRLGLLAGWPVVAHQGAADDVLRASDPAVSASFRRSAARAVAARRFSAIVTEGTAPPDGFPLGLERYYRRCPQTLFPGWPPTVFQRVAGPPGRPVYLWLPAGVSCAAAADTLDGVAAAGLQQLRRLSVKEEKARRRRLPAGRHPGEMPGPFGRSFWRSPIRGPWLTSVLGLVLLAGVSVVFVTGLLSYAAYNPDLDRINDTTHGKGLLGFYLFSWPTHPVWLYRLNQGLHVSLGLVLIPVLLAKLWSVLPKLFEWPPLRSPAHALERLSLFLLVGGAVFEFVTGVLNIQQWYKFPGSFYTLHFYGAWVFVAGFVVHVALKSRTVIRSLRTRGLIRELRTDTAHTEPEPPDSSELVSPAPAAPTISRRGALAFAGGGSLLLLALSAGQSLGGPLRRTALLAPHGQDLGPGPNDFQINQTAAQVGIRAAETGPSWRLTLNQAGPGGPTPVRLSRANLLGLDQHTAHLPIACVEGWSTDNQAWTGVRLRDLARLAGLSHPASVRVESLERGGTFRHVVLSAGQIMDPDSLLALRVNGADLSLDHGYPARVIVPASPGVHNTKWVARLTFAS